MINTTLCYISRGEDYLMLHRVKKENDLNHDKWIGIGGKFEDFVFLPQCQSVGVESVSSVVEKNRQFPLGQ